MSIRLDKNAEKKMADLEKQVTGLLADVQQKMNAETDSSDTKEEDFDFFDFDDKESPVAGGVKVEVEDDAKPQEEDDDEGEGRESMLFNVGELAVNEFELPEFPEDLKMDPRTGLEIIDIPERYKSAMGLCYKTGSPIIHFVDTVEKFNSRGKWEKRYIVITNCSIFLVRPNKEVARCLQMNTITGIATAEPNLLAIKVASEFDMVVKTDIQESRQAAHKCVEAICKARTAGANATLKEETFSDLAGLKASVNLNKPKNWQSPKNQYAHTKAELWQHLKILATQKGVVTANVDPRTGLKVLKVPAGLKAILDGREYWPASGDGVLHFFAPCIKTNSKLEGDRRLCICSNTAIYLLYPTGELQRCIRITAISQILTGKTYTALRVQNEFDVLLKFSAEVAFAKYLEVKEDANVSALFIEVLQKVSMFRTNRLIELDMNPDNLCDLDLTKPKKWNKSFIPIIGHKQMMDHLRRLGFKFTSVKATDEADEEGCGL